MEVLCEPPIFVKAQPKDAEPPNNKLHLTNVDQLWCFNSPVVLFYRCIPGDAEDLAGAVRRGVEVMVAHHYPWAAGRLQAVADPGYGVEGRRFEIRINEDGGPGVQFVSAHANCPLAHLGDLTLPNPAFEPLFATVDDNIPLPSKPLVAFKVTKFEDGGFCVSMTALHALFDGVGASIFIRNVSSCARGESLCVQMDKAPREQRIKPLSTPLLQSSCPYWPLEKTFAKELTIKEQSYIQMCAATKFEFLKEDLAKLRVQVLSNQEGCNTCLNSCSLFQVLAALLWRAKARSMPPLTCQDPFSEVFPLHIIVSVRERIIPGIPYGYMGNALVMAIAFASRGELKEKPLAFAVERIQKAIRQVAPTRFQSEVDYLQMLGGNARIIPAPMAVSSVAGQGFYDVDFGWGKPTNFGRFHKKARNLVNIVDGSGQFTSFHALPAFDSQDELKRFRDSLNLDFFSRSCSL